MPNTVKVNTQNDISYRLYLSGAHKGMAAIPLAATKLLWTKYKRWIIGGSLGALFLTFAGKLAFNLAVNLITLWFEHASGYFQAAPIGSETYLSDGQRITIAKTQAAQAASKQQPPVEAKDDSKTAAPKDVQSKPLTPEQTKSELPIVNVTFDHFAATYSSLSERDRSTYIHSLAGKKVTWVAYIKQIYLYQNVIYLSQNKEGATDVSVDVDFTDDMRLSIGPVKSKIQVSGTVEIRDRWIVINATALSVVP
jgi:hypothetical protein